MARTDVRCNVMWPHSLHSLGNILSAGRSRILLPPDTPNIRIQADRVRQADLETGGYIQVKTDIYIKTDRYIDRQT